MLTLSAMRSKRLRLILISALTMVTVVTMSARADELPPLTALDQQLDLQEFAGDWHVIASIPVKIPFFDDSRAHNYIESYKILPDGVVQMTCAFNKDAFTGKRKTFSFKAKSVDINKNTEWDVKFLWPFRARYMVIYKSETENTVIVAVPNRRWAWILKRDADISEAHYAELIAFLDQQGFAIEKVRRVPHRASTQSFANSRDHSN